jgi:4-amino-4-deoxy-L-arabinose transferase-like glycosyltransferase
MTDASFQSRTLGRWAALGFWVEVGLWLRVAAALVVQWFAQRKGVRCLFPDTEIYLELARAIRAGGPYEVAQWGLPQLAIRTPGYPLFLAACQAAFGDRMLPIRLVQAVLAATCIWMVARLVRCVRPAPLASVLAAALVAIEPYTVAISAFALSEALFVPLMVLGLWGLATLWERQKPDAPWAATALGAGVVMGAAILVKPSWALFPPLALAVWVASSRGRRRPVYAGSVLVVLGVGAIMAPWWIRNAEIFGRFVPTALWAGASLYDGWNPRATGASEMSFLHTPEMQPLDEVAQDELLLRRASEFARSHPARVLRLAAIKAGRFWSPWPSADLTRTPWRYAAAVIALPLYVLMAVGAWECRRDTRALVLLAGPLLYFAALHMVFVSSLRYRIPGAVPALGLAAIGLARLGKLTLVTAPAHE